MTPVSSTGRLASVALLMRPVAICVAVGIPILMLFSIGPLESKSRLSCVPVPISMARIFMIRVYLSEALIRRNRCHGGGERCGRDQSRHAFRTAAGAGAL